MAIFLAGSCLGSGMRISSTPSLYVAVMSASVTPSGSGSDRDSDLPWSSPPAARQGRDPADR